LEGTTMTVCSSKPCARKVPAGRARSHSRGTDRRDGNSSSQRAGMSCSGPRPPSHPVGGRGRDDLSNQLRFRADLDICNNLDWLESASAFRIISGSSVLKAHSAIRSSHHWWGRAPLRQQPTRPVGVLRLAIHRPAGRAALTSPNRLPLPTRRSCVAKRSEQRPSMVQAVRHERRQYAKEEGQVPPHKSAFRVGLHDGRMHAERIEESMRQSFVPCRRIRQPIPKG
jgi:hypothetical protein